MSEKSRMRMMLLGVFAMTGCAGEAGSTPEVEATQRTLLEVEVKGVPVQFVEFNKGVLMALATSAPGQNPIGDAAIRGMTLTQMYEHWTGTQAPPALVEAQLRANAATGAGDDIPADLEDAVQLATPARDTFVPKSRLTAQQFQDAYCGDMQMCQTNITGTIEYEHRSAWIAGEVNPYRGDVTLQIRAYTVIGGWQNTLVRDILDGQEIRFTGGGNPLVPRKTKVKIYNADGDGYHFAMTW
jgi:hypothetical protein